MNSITNENKLLVYACNAPISLTQFIQGMFKDGITSVCYYEIYDTDQYQASLRKPRKHSPGTQSVDLIRWVLPSIVEVVTCSSCDCKLLLLDLL